MSDLQELSDLLGIEIIVKYPQACDPSKLAAIKYTCDGTPKTKLTILLYDNHFMFSK